MLFWRYKVAYEITQHQAEYGFSCRTQKIVFAEIDKVENREDLEKLRAKYLGREKVILTAVLWEDGDRSDIDASFCSYVRA
jgi:hypothetical protein